MSVPGLLLFWLIGLVNGADFIIAHKNILTLPLSKVIGRFKSETRLRPENSGTG